MSPELFLNTFIKGYDRQGLITNEWLDEEVSQPIVIDAAAPGMPSVTPELSWPNLLPATADSIFPKNWIDKSGLRLLLGKLYILTLVERVYDFAYLFISEWDETIESAEAIA